MSKKRTFAVFVALCGYLVALPLPAGVVAPKLSPVPSLAAAGVDAGPDDSRLTEVRKIRNELAHVLPKLERRGGGQKTRATVEVIDCFLGWIGTDVEKGFAERADREADELLKVAREERARLVRVAAGSEKDENGPTYVTSPVRNSRMQTVATRRWPDGRTDQGPVFFNGFGHFSLIQQDLAKMPVLGNNILQTEIGPAWVFPSEDTVNERALDSFLELARRAARENVQVCLLLSPHYFPDWAFAKWPEIKDDAGFIKFCIHDPRVREILEKYLRFVIPRIRHLPALHSLCISNEAENYEYGKCKVLRREWPKWLAKRFGTVDKMNAKWRTSYASFDQVPIPEKWSGNKPSAELVEFARFDRRLFSEFHEWMAGVIRSMAPEIPLHAKIMCQNWQWTTPTLISVDIEDFAALSDLNGNDCTYWPFPKPDPKCCWGDSVSEWPLCEIAYDYQRSAAEKPIFNSENHIIRDREKDYVCGRHVYTALWQQALHGQAMSTLWTWERAYDDGKSDFNGLILERPECLAAWAHCSLDLNRLADRLAPIQNQEASVLLLNSLSSRLWGCGIDPSYECYRALNCLGRQIGVVSERMLAAFARTGTFERPLKDARAIVMPMPSNLPDDVRKALKTLTKRGVDVIAYGCRPAADDCGNLRDGGDFDFLEQTDGTTLMKTFAKLAEKWRLPDVPHVLSPDGNFGVEGVESRGCWVGGKSYMSVVNHGPRPVRVRLEQDGVDLITGTVVKRLMVLESQSPMFVEFDRSPKGSRP